LQNLHEKNVKATNETKSTIEKSEVEAAQFIKEIQGIKVKLDLFKSVYENKKKDLEHFTKQSVKLIQLTIYSEL
jgi:hypothetical protein